MRIHISDDASMISLIDCSRYVSFAGDDWYADHRLTNHLVAQCNRQTILSWGAGFETDWLVEVKQGITDTSGYREFFGHITCSSGVLYFANYDSLTMAAQYRDYLLPDKETSGYRLDLPQGRYRVRVVQTIDPKESWEDTLGENPAFLIEYESTDESPSPVSQIPWVEFMGI